MHTVVMQILIRRVAAIYSFADCKEGLRVAAQISERTRHGRRFLEKTCSAHPKIMKIHTMGVGGGALQFQYYNYYQLY